MTLPLIFALNNANTSDRKRIIRNIKKYNEDTEKVKEVIEFVRASGGIEYARNAMREYREQAFELLHTFPETAVRNSLEQLVTFVTNRKK